MGREYFVRNKTGEIGPLTSADVKRMTADGDLTAIDQIRREGDEKWTLLAEVPQLSNLLKSLRSGHTEGSTKVPQQTSSPIAVEVEGVQPAPAVADLPSLWTPYTIRLLAFFLTTPLGAYLTATNWKNLSRERECRNSMRWFYSVLGVTFIFYLLPDGAATFSRMTLLGIFAAWAYFDALPQAKFVKETIGLKYRNRSFVKPSAVAAGCLIFCLLFFDNRSSSVVGDEAGAVQSRPSGLFGGFMGRTIPITKERGEDSLTLNHNASLQSAMCRVGTAEVTISFDVDESKWIRSLGSWHHLRVTFYDADKDYLDHFVTRERFTAIKEVYDHLLQRYQTEKQYGIQAKKPPIVLSSSGNTLSYPVDPNVLQMAKYVQIGFID